MNISQLAPWANLGGALSRQSSARLKSLGLLARGPRPEFGAIFRSLLLAGIFSSPAHAAGAPAVTLEWDANPEPDIAGYELRYGEASGVYSSVINAGNTTTTAVSGLTEGRTYYFTVSAYNTKGLKSPPSQEVSHTLINIPTGTSKLHFVDSEDTAGYAAEYAFDGDPNTFWHTAWRSNAAPPPHELQIDLGTMQELSGFRYLPRQDNYNDGNINQYEFYVSSDGATWEAPVASGNFANSKEEKVVSFSPKSGRYIRLVALSEATGLPFTSVAELTVIRSDGPPDVVTNTAPFATAQSVATPQNTPLRITLTGTDAEQAALNYEILSAPKNGKLSGTAPNLTYSPNTNYNGSDSFTFRTNDGITDSASAVVSITVTTANFPDAPSGNLKVHYVDSEDTNGYPAEYAFDGDPNTFWHTVWRSNAPPPPHELQIDLGTMQELSGFRYLPRQDNFNDGTINRYEFYVSTDGANWGTPVASGNFANSKEEKSVSFSPKSGRYIRLVALSEATGLPFTSVAELTVIQSDGPPDVVTNTAPFATAQSLTTTEDGPLDITLTGTDAEQATLLYEVVSAPQNGTLSGVAPSLTYLPEANYHGPDSFTFRVWDGTVHSAPATVSISVSSVNYAPVAATNSVTTPEDKPVSVFLTASDNDADALSFEVVNGPANGVLSGIAPDLTYTPKANYHGPDSFTFRAWDGTVHSAPATVSISVSSINYAPVASTNSVTTSEDTPVSISLSATDKDTDALSFEIVTGPTSGLLSGIAPDLTYTPTANYHGPDSFTYRVTDGTVHSAPATISITVTSVNDAPAADSFALETPAGSPMEVVLTGHDPDENTLAFVIVSAPTKGSLSGAPPKLTYQPDPGSTGSDQFTYLASDGTLNSPVATVSIKITSVSIPSPTITTPSLSISGAVGAEIEGKLKATHPIAEEILTFSKVTGPDWLGVSSVGALSGTPQQADIGVNTFTIQVTDSKGQSDQTTLTINVAPVAVLNRGPVFTGNPIFSGEASENAAYTGQSLAGKALDPDAGDTITYWKVEGPEWLQIARDGQLSGTPPPGSAGINSFHIRAADSSLATADTELRINVVGLPLPWKSSEVGTGQLIGSVSYLNGTFTQTGSGALGGSSDKARYTYHTLSGNGSITAKVSLAQNNGPAAYVGIMLRESMSPRSRQIFLGLGNDQSYRLVTRTSAGENHRTRSRPRHLGAPRSQFRQKNGLLLQKRGRRELDLHRCHKHHPAKHLPRRPCGIQR
jgi:F5/8 type C domain/Bacterial Ig domain/Fibronectin type III domain/Putative Ig domain